MSKRASPDSFISQPSKFVLRDEDDDESSDDSSDTPELYSFLRPAVRELVHRVQENTAIYNHQVYDDSWTDFGDSSAVTRRVRVTCMLDEPYDMMLPLPSCSLQPLQAHTPSPHQEAGLAFCALRHEPGYYVNYLCRDIAREIGQYVQSN